MIIPVWQPLFSSSHLLAKAIGESRKESATHTGTLDPMAQGVLIVLTGKDRYLKGKLDFPKIYEFQILWGVQTDSGDQLGIITEASSTRASTGKLEEILLQFPTKYEQRIPDFSARRWKGQSAFDAAKRGEQTEPKSRLVSILNLSLLTTKVLSLSEVLSQQQSNVAQVSGDFRQAEILENWRNVFSSLPADSSFTVTTHAVEVSLGTYIRQLVQDIAKQMDVPATTWSITRTKNGPYKAENISR